MSEEFFVKYGSPTLAGIKTGSLFLCPMDSRESVIRDMADYNRRLLSKGLCMIPINFIRDNVLVYMFRPKRLKKDLENPAARQILKKSGYNDGHYTECLKEIASRIRRNGEFPHEIGLFLSYPPEDVLGFMENHAENYKCIGSWKVYGDEAEAKRKFAVYNKCTEVYSRLMENGKTLSDLAVAV